MRDKVIEDMAQLLTSFIGATAGSMKDMQSGTGKSLDALLGSLNVVRRDEFDVVRKMAQDARAEVAELKAELAKLKKPAATQKTTKKKTAKK